MAVATPTCQFPLNNVIQNSADNGTYKTVEFSLNKRQSHHYSASAGFGYTLQHDFPRGFPNTPNGPVDYDFSIYSFKANAIYNAPWGINISPVFRFQAGINYARTLRYAAGLLQVPRPHLPFASHDLKHCPGFW